MNLEQFVVFRCVVGSRAHGLNRDSSDFDRRGFYLPPAQLQWSLDGIPEQLENEETQECYWELRKFLLLALKSNPNVLECLYSPIVELQTEVAEAIVVKRDIFLSKLSYESYDRYAQAQFRKLEQDLRTVGHIKWKHAMHMVRLLLQGIDVLRFATVNVYVGDHRDALLAIREGEWAWERVDEWRNELHKEFEAALAATSLPDRPDYAEANRLLIWARRQMVNA